jgi:hypothetical protein
MTLPETWEWTEPPSMTATAQRWIAPDVFHMPGEEPADVKQDPKLPEPEGEYGLEEPEGEYWLEANGGLPHKALIPLDEEVGSVELAEWQLTQGATAQAGAFPSGLTLQPGTGDTSRDGEHWDPNGVNLPLYATGSQVRTLRCRPTSPWPSW